MWPGGIVFGVMFLIFAGIAVQQVASIDFRAVATVFDLVTALFTTFWVLGWSVGVGFLFVITILLLTYRESARLSADRLIYIPQLGPIKVIAEYELRKIRNLRTVDAKEPGRVRIRFGYGEGDTGLGNDMPLAEAESRIVLIAQAIERSKILPRAAEESSGIDITRFLRRRSTPRLRNVVPSQPAKPAESGGGTLARPVLTAPSSVALLAANAFPLAGIALFDWDLGEIMVLFWAENAVIGFYTLLRLAVVARWMVVFAGTFFVAHYGAFMVGHFMFVYYLFVLGIGATGPEPGVVEALGDLFLPLWPALVGLFTSHGVSFYTNFLKRREYVGRTVNHQMAEPYKRVMVMHVTIIFGGWIIMLLGQPVGALVLLIALKTAVDLRSHRTEHS